VFQQYEVLQRIVTVEDPRTAAQARTVEALLGDDAVPAPARLAGFVYDLSPALDRTEDVLAFLRGEQLAHVVSDERRWRPRPADGVDRFCALCGSQEEVEVVEQPDGHAERRCAGCAPAEEDDDVR